MILQPTFDPTNPTSGQFNLNLTGGYGKAVLYNESNSNLKLIFSNNFTDYLPAWTAIELCFINIALTNPIVKYETLSTLSGIVASPISQVAIVTYEASEHVPGTYPAALVRSLSIGNQVNSTTTTNQVTNDGNPTVTTFVEATQSGNASGSNVAIGNDGSFTFAQFVSSVYTNLFQLIPGASPLLRLGAKLVLEAVDNSGANISNIFGVDSSGNTFLQNHKTNNQTVIYDKNGATLLIVDANAQVKVTGSSSLNNGDTSGVQAILEGVYGIYKIVIVQQNNYRQAGGAFQNTLKNTFGFGAAWLNMGCGGLEATNGGAALSSNQITWGTGTSAGTSAGGTGMPSFSAGLVVSPISKIGDSGGYASAHSGFGIFIGV
jgi:hypothetical protein